MRLDISKIDERIKKLQELRRIATDSEMAQLLSEFLLSDGGAASAAAAASTGTVANAGAAPETLPHGDGVSDLVKGVLDSKESLPRGGSGWGGRKS